MPRKLSAEDFLKRAKEIHGDKYDYSMVDYRGYDSEVKIVCPIHGIFLQTPHRHLNGQGCQECGRISSIEKRRKGLQYFLEEARSVHGDKYDYSKVELKSRRDKVCIICPIHGEFWQAPHNHTLQRQGCPKCARESNALKIKKDTEWFLQKAHEIHGDRFDYSETHYVYAKKKVCVICHELDDGGHEHGRFWIEPPRHLLRSGGCPKCGHPKHTIEWFIRQSHEVHGDKYDYSQTVYVNNHTPISIICPEHGPFAISPSYFLTGAGCPKCSGRIVATADFIEAARKVHGDKYEYDKVRYANKTTPVIITCPKHGDFEQTPFNHLRGNGCIKCHIESRLLGREAFIAKAIEVHGDMYDYSEVDYSNSKTKVRVICPLHGAFMVTPNNHLKGSGCPVCFGTPKKTTEQFIEEVRSVHGDRFDYEMVDYQGVGVKVCVVCPEHGPFWAMPHHLLKGGGCPDCSGLKPITVDVFKSRSAVVHHGKYDYSKVDFSSVNEKVCIVCPEHGEFWQSASSHMHGYACPKCSGKYMDTAFFKQKASVIHHGKYDYSKTVFTGAFEKVIITCPIHGDYEQVASYHLSGNGCPACNESHMERDVRYSLEFNHIPFESQKTFDWLVYDGKMSLDFFISEYGVAVECQGAQHFSSIDYFGGEEAYEKVRARDMAKLRLCEEHGIKVLYYSDLGIDYPYFVLEDLDQLIDAILAGGEVDSSKWKDPELPFVFE